MTSLDATGNYPNTRLRRLRQSAWCRELVAEHRLDASDLVWPVFIQEGDHHETPINSMPGVSRLTIDLLLERAKRARTLGIRAIAVFPFIETKLKSLYGDEALFPNNLVCRAIRAVKDAVPDIGVIADIALDPYTTHGQDGVVVDGRVHNDDTVKILCKQALALAKAGCDIVAPSDMMDGRIGAIRTALEEGGFPDMIILAYSAKYASSLYAPFREAVDSARHLGMADKKGYQMDPPNAQEALREIALDIKEGADIVMVKPGGPYLDIITRAAQAFSVPIFAYQVSGEYSMIKAAAEKGFLDGDAAMLESLLAFKRAGARAILTYAAVEVAEKLQS